MARSRRKKPDGFSGSLKDDGRIAEEFENIAKNEDVLMCGPMDLNDRTLVTRGDEDLRAIEYDLRHDIKKCRSGSRRKMMEIDLCYVQREIAVRINRQIAAKEYAERLEQQQQEN